MFKTASKADSNENFFGHPAGLSTLFFTEMWERMSYYGMRALLVLFMTLSIQDGGLGLTVASATAFYGLYTGAVYLEDNRPLKESYLMLLVWRPIPCF